MNFDNIRNDTISAEYDQLDQLVSMLSDDTSISAERLTIETRDGNTLIVESTDSIEVSKE